MDTQYRIRWGRVTDCGGRIRRMCIGEKKHRIFGFFMWGPLVNCDWRATEAEVLRDITNDKALYQPLPAPINIV